MEQRRRQRARSKIMGYLDEIDGFGLMLAEWIVTYAVWRQNHIRQARAAIHWVGKEVPQEFFIHIFGVELSWQLPPKKSI